MSKYSRFSIANEFESNKHVQFSRNLDKVQYQSSEIRTNRSNSLSLPSFSLEYNSSLTEIHQENLDEIRQLIPDEFEKLIPILIQLGVIILPKKFLDENNQQQLTTKELIERHRLFISIKNYQENLQYKNDLQHLYGNIFSTLRESLSFTGQLALIHSYQDQIEQELNKKMFGWRLIQINNSEYSYSTNKSVLMKKKSLTIKSNEKFSLPKQLDQQWQRKLIPFIIEQGFILLDQIRSLPSNLNSSNDDINLIRAFKRWTFLWSTLYEQQ